MLKEGALGLARVDPITHAKRLTAALFFVLLTHVYITIVAWAQI